MAHQVPTGDLPETQRTPQSDDPSLPQGTESEPPDPGSLRPGGMGMLAGVLFLLVFVAVLLVALVWAAQAIS